MGDTPVSSYSAEQAYELILLSLVTWREARGEIVDAKRGVAWTIMNRAKHPSWWGSSIVGVCLKPFQFSSMNPTDPNAVKWPSPLDTTWMASLAAAEEAYNGTGIDPTGGASHYYDDSLATPPSWATSGTLKFMKKIGRLNFYG